MSGGGGVSQNRNSGGCIGSGECTLNSRRGIVFGHGVVLKCKREVGMVEQIVLADLRKLSTSPLAWLGPFRPAKREHAMINLRISTITDIGIGIGIIGCQLLTNH